MKLTRFLIAVAVCSYLFVQGTTSIAAPGAAKVLAEDFFRAIRADDKQELQRLSSVASVNIRDGLQTSPLHYAALYGSIDSVRILLDGGADSNARNQQDATPLIYAAYDVVKTRLLVEKGAAVNAATHAGRTPLLVASAVHGNCATVKYLLDKGADVKATDARGVDALATAAAMSEPETLRLLLARGADPKRKDAGGGSALLAASTVTAERDRTLLDAGADVNTSNDFGGRVKNGPLALVHLTPLSLAVPYAPTESIAVLLKAGAHVNYVDIRKMTPLMMAVATDRAKPETVRQLIAAGADVTAKDQNGESVLDWARKFRNPEIVQTLERTGAQGQTIPVPPVRPASYQPHDAADAVARGAALMTKAGQQFFPAGGGCIGCHHQAMAARGYVAARDAGLPTDDRTPKLLLDGMLAFRPFALTQLPVMSGPGGDFDTLLWPLAGLADLNEPATAQTDVMLHYIAARQQLSGVWAAEGIARPPIEDSDITRTALAIRALTVYGWPARRSEFSERIDRARHWLLTATPVTNYERADLLMGLFYAAAPEAELHKIAAALLRVQRVDGGWAQTQYLDSDAYATGMALHALYRAGLLKPADAPYQRGVAYLLGTQFPDGSWFVRSRSPKFQPYFQSGFPFDHDQWISSAATGWAVMALAPAAALSTHAALRP